VRIAPGLAASVLPLSRWRNCCAQPSGEHSILVSVSVQHSHKLPPPRNHAERLKCGAGEYQGRELIIDEDVKGEKIHE
jgi:hypothetical protein